MWWTKARILQKFNSHFLSESLKFLNCCLCQWTTGCLWPSNVALGDAAGVDGWMVEGMGNTVDGNQNPVNSPVEVGSLSHYSKRFSTIPGGASTFSINSIMEEHFAVVILVSKYQAPGYKSSAFVGHQIKLPCECCFLGRDLLQTSGLSWDHWRTHLATGGPSRIAQIFSVF